VAQRRLHGRARGAYVLGDMDFGKMLPATPPFAPHQGDDFAGYAQLQGRQF
jgi:hypothetical protein